MNKDKIEQIVKQSINQSIAGQEIENKKFDFKKKWYDLTDKKGINEFLKDTSSIANTFGLDGLIVIGFDDKTKVFEDSVFSNCGLKDKSQIYQVLIKRLSHPFDINIYDFEINKHQVSIIHIPPTLEKPFLIKNYQTYHKDGKEKKREEHKIFVRKDAGTFPATKYDIDLMYYDRKNFNIQKSYDVEVNLTDYNFYFAVHNSTNHYIDLDKLPNLKNDMEYNFDRLHIAGKFSFAFENIGKKPLSISLIIMSFPEMTIYEELADGDKLVTEYTDDIIISYKNFKDKVIIIPSGQSDTFSLELVSGYIKNLGYKKEQKKFLDLDYFSDAIINGYVDLRIVLSNGTELKIDNDFGKFLRYEDYFPNYEKK